MSKVLIIGASGGIGSALGQGFAAQGASVDRLSRSDDGFDVTDAASVSAHLAGRRPFWPYCLHAWGPSVTIGLAGGSVIAVQKRR